MLLLLVTTLVLTQPAPPKPAAQRLSAAQQAYQLTFGAYRSGSGRVDEVAEWSRRIYEAQKDTDKTAAKSHLDRLLALEKLVLQRHQKGDASALDVQADTWARADAELLAPQR